MPRPWSWKCQVLPKWNTWQPSVALCDRRWTWGKRSRAPRVEGPQLFVSHSQAEEQCPDCTGLVAELNVWSPHIDFSGRGKSGTKWRDEHARIRNFWLAISNGFSEERQKETQPALTCPPLIPPFKYAACHRTLGKGNYFFFPTLYKTVLPGGFRNEWWAKSGNKKTCHRSLGKKSSSLWSQWKKPEERPLPHTGITCNSVE